MNDVNKKQLIRARCVNNFYFDGKQTLENEHKTPTDTGTPMYRNVLIVVIHTRPGPPTNTDRKSHISSHYLFKSVYNFSNLIIKYQTRKAGIQFQLFNS